MSPFLPVLKAVFSLYIYRKEIKSHLACSVTERLRRNKGGILQAKNHYVILQEIHWHIGHCCYTSTTLPSCPVKSALNNGKTQDRH